MWNFSIEKKRLAEKFKTQGNSGGKRGGGGEEEECVTSPSRRRILNDRLLIFNVGEPGKQFRHEPKEEKRSIKICAIVLFFLFCKGIMIRFGRWCDWGSDSSIRVNLLLSQSKACIIDFGITPECDRRGGGGWRKARRLRQESKLIGTLGQTIIEHLATEREVKQKFGSSPNNFVCKRKEGKKDVRC